MYRIPHPLPPSHQYGGHPQAYESVDGGPSLFLDGLVGTGKYPVSLPAPLSIPPPIPGSACPNCLQYHGSDSCPHQEPLALFDQPPANVVSLNGLRCVVCPELRPPPGAVQAPGGLLPVRRWNAQQGQWEEQRADATWGPLLLTGYPRYWVEFTRREEGRTIWQVDVGAPNTTIIDAARVEASLCLARRQATDEVHPPPPMTPGRTIISSANPEPLERHHHRVQRALFEGIQSQQQNVARAQQVSSAPDPNETSVKSFWG